ncbi:MULTISPECIES: MFS transporter [Nocardiopsidaceae]|uniref:MFS transporter n=1 Tax=Streptomonospora nanhaiensis TaxID=1323731 RepID=A0ABY6YI62_9ACTN|nr:MFS transporter [Streptomonospora nanhaiensis]WAE71952.1 MFS transporter [Streptomonospora nanhaiensis]
MSTNTPPAPGRPSPRPTPRLSPAFHRFWAGSLSSNLADGIMLTALPMLAAALTNDPLAVAGLTAARYLPWLLFGLLAGALVDRVDRVRAMVAANLLRAAAITALAILTATGNATVTTLYIVMFAAMTCEIVYDTAGRAILPALARTALDRANGRLVGGREVAQEFAGAPLGGFLFAIAAALPLATNAGAYALGALILLGLPLTARRAPAPPTDQPATPPADPVRAVLHDIGQGLRHIHTDPPLRALILFGATLNLGAAAVTAVFVLTVQDHYGVPPHLFGVFLATAALGAIGGALLAGNTAHRIGRYRGITAGYLAQAAFCTLFALAPDAPTAAAAWTLVAAASAYGTVLSSGILQQIVPEHLMGRVSSAKQMLGLGLAPAGALLGGLLARADLRAPALFGAAVFTAATLLALRHLRTATARADANEQAARADPAH